MNKEKQIEEMAEIITSADPYVICKGQSCLTCEFNHITKNCYAAKAIYNAGYSKQNENTITLPCKLNDVVWYIAKRDGDTEFNVYHAVARAIDIRSSNMYVILHWEDECFELHKVVLRFSDFGVAAFLTQNEAEQALMETKRGM